MLSVVNSNIVISFNVFCEFQEKGERGEPGESVFGPPGVPGGQGGDGRAVSIISAKLITIVQR